MAMIQRFRLQSLAALLCIFSEPLWACTGSCGSQWAVLTPQGSIASQEKDLILTALGLMLLVVIPTITMTLYFAWKYRASNETPDYAPNWDHSSRIEKVIWGIPTLIIAILGTLVWISTHRLSPYRPLSSPYPPLEVQVVAMDWKWLFIYPDLKVATLNQLVIPAGVPVHFVLTSDAVMSSFFIPQLGGQIYAMAGMTTHLHLIADQPGVFEGYNTQFSGPGFAGMHFETRALPSESFHQWVQTASHAPAILDHVRLTQLEQPTTDVPPQIYRVTAPRLFNEIVESYQGPHDRMKEN
jgi:cytochrome bo3 quinol oxidase subunit 2 (EC 1.10.3.-)